jgi:hypothetical protein
VVILYIFPRFGILYREKSGNPAQNTLAFKTGSRAELTGSAEGPSASEARLVELLLRQRLRSLVDALEPIR